MPNTKKITNSGRRTMATESQLVKKPIPPPPPLDPTEVDRVWMPKEGEINESIAKSARTGDVMGARFILQSYIRATRAISGSQTAKFPLAFKKYLADAFERILSSERPANIAAKALGVVGGRGAPKADTTWKKAMALAAGYELLQRGGLSARKSREILEQGFTRRAIERAAAQFPEIEGEQFCDSELRAYLTPAVATLINRFLVARSPR